MHVCVREDSGFATAAVAFSLFRFIECFNGVALASSSDSMPACLTRGAFSIYFTCRGSNSARRLFVTRSATD